jgi:hypothetical protein
MAVPDTGIRTTILLSYKRSYWNPKIGFQAVLSAVILFCKLRPAMNTKFDDTHAASHAVTNHTILVFPKGSKINKKTLMSDV